MAATVLIRRRTGASGSITETDITGINTRANAEDAHSTAGTTNPIKVPASGTNYSYWVSTRLDATVTPAGTIDNLRWFTDGANGLGTGITAKGAKASTTTDAGYREATGTPGETGTQLLQANHSGLDEAPADIFGFTSGSPKALTGSISNPSTGQFGDHWVYQIEVDDTAGPGASGSETLTFRYDET
jgi:hypothetical protein